MGLRKAVLGAITCGASLKSLTDIINHADPGWLPIGAGVSAEIYGLADFPTYRPGFGVSVYCSIQAINQVANHGDSFWWTIAAIGGAIIYGLADNKKVRTIVKRVTDHGRGGLDTGRPAPPNPPAPYPLPPHYRPSASGKPKPIATVANDEDEGEDPNSNLRRFEPPPYVRP